ncbi:Peptidoglycan D,D-transpeptidase FtsI [Candidatus Erwinia haradaeae]|uniref:Peptidoglycan D,D-transpeptidase FtsI n=1 Tax=Candidatus Erwinia haradaeae TaxID=1922217 RepID=A0A451DK17_9GAMM|nr:peptidoglycan glycosyltransferase FtsI [Candidatus Erwinia haradaeae]VFP86998.1 Peptidoglycan D,D-transpeptidase FtsI [Candidatus Erwinia haradaeae]
MKRVKYIYNQRLKKIGQQSSFSYWRFTLLCSFIFFGTIGLLFRLAWLQLIYPERLVHEGDMRSLRIQVIPTSRGMITDRKGRPLAVSIPVYAILADPKELQRQGGIILDDHWKALANVLSISINKLKERINANPSSRFVYLARQVDPEISEYIQRLKLPGIFLRNESRRYYPSGEVTSHLIGVTNIDGEGIEGIEKSFNKWLTGQPGSRIVRQDRLGQVIEDIPLVDCQESSNLTLSIDVGLQTQVYHELHKAVSFHRAESGTAVLLDIHTGEVLAMVNSPSYNPNNLNGVSQDVMRNRAITDMFEPGSTVKPMVVLSALQSRVASEHSILNTEPLRINGHTVRDVTLYHELTLTGVLQKSSNVGVTRLALSMPSHVLVDTYSSFGLGKTTSLGLIGESRGFCPQKKRWSNIERAAFSFGYGLMVTPLQLARVYATFGSYGIYRPLSIMKVSTPIEGKRIFPDQTVRTVLHMMESVSLPGGCGIKAAVKDYRVAIKTGTVKKVGKNGKFINRYIAYTAGVAPASNPRFALVVVVNDPQSGQYYGGAVSAPVFSSIMTEVLHTMKVQPDAVSNFSVQKLNNLEKMRSE